MKELPLIEKKTGLYNAVIETPKHSRNKYDYDQKTGLFRLKKVLPEGMAFPFDFGFLPQTLADDGDPMDILLLMDEPGCPGSFLGIRLIGVIEALQKGKGKEVRNDRLIGVSENSLQYNEIKNIKELNETVIAQVESFFKTYNKLQGRKYKILDCHGPQKAHALVEKAHARYKKKEK